MTESVCPECGTKRDSFDEVRGRLDGWGGALGAGDVAAISVSLASIKRLVRGAFPLK